MNPVNITRDEAEQRSRIVTAHSYRVVVDLSGRDPQGNPLADPAGTFVSSSTISFSSTGEATHADLIADGVYAAELDGVPLDPALHHDHRFPIEAGVGDHELTVVALCRYSHSGEGLHRFVDPADDRVYLYTQFEIADARRMYANFEQPDLKAAFALKVLAPQGWTVISNGTTPEPSDGPYEGIATWQFPATPPISTYLTALVAGHYAVDHGTVRTREGKDIGADILCRRSMTEFLDAERIRTTTQRGFEVYEEEFGHPYPFGKYDQSFVPEFNAGAMENAGCVTHRDDYLFRSRVTSAQYEARDNTILHELAHMWFGDLVTMTWWDDLWLNESFAEWASHHCQEKIAAKHGGVNPWVSFANQRKTWGYRQDQLPTTHPIAADMVDLATVEQNFDGITYAKGASTLKQLVAFVGEEQFLVGVRAYLEAHKFANSRLSDLLEELQKASGRDLSGFTREWLRTPGVNTVRPDFDVDEDGNFTRFDIVQSAPARFPTLRTHRMGIGIYSLTQDGLVRTDGLEVDVHGERTPIAALAGRARGDLVLLNDADLSYVKVRLDEHSLKTLTEHIAALSDPLARALCWGAAWDMCRDAELRAQDYVALVIGGLGSETDLTAVQSLIRQATTAVLSYTAPELRSEVRTALISAIAVQLKDTEPGGDHQVALAGGLLAVLGAEGADLLTGWLTGEEVPEGLVVDQGMRWRIIAALARLGRAEEQLIADEQDRDNTIAGAQAAAGARAAVPTAEAKATAWKRATDERGVPNETYREIVSHFINPDQQEVLAPYAAKYLQLCAAVDAGEGQWATAGHAQIQNALQWLFPVENADRAWLDELRQWASSRTLTSTVNRVLLEESDAAERALRCQARSLS
ncbi:aminopeptidase N [Acidipropionibacterium virtanenii]|uniref:Aminopeptidase N n=1 Tax=Acidipropionibacterium virtanenii TaxID=2057246 RepID=A0A344USW9_9ACTN|nr:aminopeptidase N [Acidipropionibacterium virtanenii]AXE38367.1 Aminopeptidase N [Acidipropionibacterium virtanenii]